MATNQDPLANLAQNLRGYAQMLNALSETTLTPIAGMAFEGAKDWISQIISQAGTTVSNSASSIEALLPSDVRKTVREEVARGLKNAGIAESKSLKDALNRIENLERELARLNGVAAPAKKAPAKKAPAKKAPAKKAPAKKAPAKKEVTS